jgi:hypothetical protein
VNLSKLNYVEHSMTCVCACQQLILSSVLDDCLLAASSIRVPGFGTLDWKEFCEVRPGLIGWVLLNIA